MFLLQSSMFSLLVYNNVHAHVHKAKDVFIIIITHISFGYLIWLHVCILVSVKDRNHAIFNGSLGDILTQFLDGSIVVWWLVFSIVCSYFIRKGTLMWTYNTLCTFRSMIHVTRNDACQSSVWSNPCLRLVIASNQDNVFRKAKTLTPELFPLPLPQVHVKIRVSIGKARNANVSTIWLRATCTVVWYYTWSSPPPDLLFPYTLM